MANKGIGWFFASDHTATNADKITSVETGAYRVPDNTEPPSSYTGASNLQCVYKIATEAPNDVVSTSNADKDRSQGLVSAVQLNANPTWIATSNGTTPLHSFFQNPANGLYDGLIPDLGNAGFQAAAIANMIGYKTRQGVTAIYLDNMHGDIADLTHEVLVPHGYSSDADWRTRAAIPFINALSAAAKANGIYLFCSLSDVYDVALGEGGIDQDNGTSTTRFYGQIAAAGEVPNGAFREYWQQNAAGPVTLAAFATGDDTFYHHWDGWQTLPGAAHTAGMDFHGLTYTSGTVAAFCRASWLLDADLSRKETFWTADINGAPGALNDNDLVMDPGGVALTSKAQVGSLWWRQYPNFTVIVNPTTSSATATIQGVSRTVPASGYRYLPTVAFATTGKSTPATGVRRTIQVGFATTGKGTAATSVRGLDIVTVATTGKSTPATSVRGTDRIPLPVTGRSVPAITISAATRPVPITTTGKGTPAFTPAAMTDRVTLTVTGRSTPAAAIAAMTHQRSFAATGTAAPHFTVTAPGAGVLPFHTTSASTIAFTRAGMTDGFTLSTTSRATPAFTVTYKTRLPVPVTGRSVPVFTLAAATKHLSFAVTGASSAAVTVSTISHIGFDTVPLTVTGRSVPSFGALLVALLGLQQSTPGTLSLTPTTQGTLTTHHGNPHTLDLTRGNPHSLALTPNVPGTLSVH